MLSKMSRAVSAAAITLFLTSGTVMAQLTSAPKSTGPSGSQVMGDFAAWFDNHRGAAIALAIVVVLTIGYIAWGFLKPKTGAAEK